MYVYTFAENIATDREKDEFVVVYVATTTATVRIKIRRRKYRMLKICDGNSLRRLNFIEANAWLYLSNSERWY